MSGKYFNPYTDFGFKKLFGEEANKDLLIDFLNQLLPNYHQIAELNFKNTENLPAIEIERKAFFDIYCESVTGEKFIVEMQKAKAEFLKIVLYFIPHFRFENKLEKVNGRLNYCRFILLQYWILNVIKMKRSGNLDAIFF